MKYIKKIVLFVFLCSFVFVMNACTYEPSWQTVDRINTNANYIQISYDSMQEDINASDENKIKEREGIIKVSYSFLSDKKNVIIAGLVNTNNNAEMQAALKVKITSFSEILRETELKIELTAFVTPQYIYIEYESNRYREKEDIKLKLNKNESDLVKSFDFNIFSGYIEKLQNLAKFDGVLNDFALKTENEKANFTVKKSANKSGATKYLMELNNDNKFEKSDWIMRISSGSLSKFKTYVCFDSKRNLSEYFSETEGTSTDYSNFKTTCSFKYYSRKMPSITGVYMTLSEYIESLGIEMPY